MDYESLTKEHLLAEANGRGVEGVKSSMSKADIIAALQLDDEQGDKGPVVAPPLPAPVVSNIPFVAKPEIITAEEKCIPDSDFTDGLWKMRERVPYAASDGEQKWRGTLHPGEVFALCIHPEDNYQRTHSLKNTVHFWQGKESDFVLNFEKA